MISQCSARPPHSWIVQLDNSDKGDCTLTPPGLPAPIFSAEDFKIRNLYRFKQQPLSSCRVSGTLRNLSPRVSALPPQTSRPGLKPELSVSILIVWPRRESLQLRLRIRALSSLTPADKEICLSLSKCELSAKPIKCPFTQLLQQCAPTHNARTDRTIC